MLIAALAVVAGFALLLRGADALISGAGSIARRAGLSQLFIGLTVVAFGTSAPELTINIFAALDGRGAVAVGNILGSGIADTTLGLGLAAALGGGLVFARLSLLRDGPASALSPLLFLGVCLLASGGVASVLTVSGSSLPAVASDAGQAVTAAAASLPSADGLLLSRVAATALLVAFAVYFYSVLRHGGADTADDSTCRHRPLSAWLLVAAGAAGLAIGGRLVVSGGSELAAGFGVSETLIGLTVVAAGSSLPEIVTAVRAARAGQGDIAVGGILGTQVFNALLVLGVSGLISPLLWPRVLLTDIVALTGLNALALALALAGGRRLGMSAGVLLVVSYAVYVTFIIYRG